MRSLARWGSLPLLAAPMGSWALGLGEIETNSYLNQPLNAQIPLTATAEELQSLRVSLAPVSAFTAQGLDYPAALASIQFRVGRNEAGENVIFVTSRESIEELALTMVVQASHSRGVLNKEFSVLLDPPVFRSAEAPREPIAAPATREPAPAAGGNIVRQPPQPVPQAQPQARPQPQQPAAPARAPAPVDPNGYTVAAGDTLWSIAERYRPDGVSTNQAMISIFEANASAFDGNINRLRRGAILRIPPAQALGSTAAATANAEVRRQTEAWQAGGGATQQLVLIPPSEELAPGNVAAGAAAAGGADAARVAALEAELRQARSEIEAARAAAAEAERRLLEVQSAALANVQQQAAAPDAAVEEPIFAEAAPEAAETAAVVEAPAEVPAAAATAAAEAGQAEPAPAPAATARAADEISLVDRIVATIMQPLVWGGAIVVALLIGALAFLRRRREGLEDVTGQWEALEAEIGEDTDHAATQRMRAVAVEPDMLVVEGFEDEGTADEPSIDATAEIARLDNGTAELNSLALDDETPGSARRGSTSRGDTSLADQTLSSQTVINLDQADPIAEADFHMAYGLYDQAADLISKALSADPGDRALKMKLLEVYFVWGNKELFLESALALKKEIGGGPDWDKVVIMGKQICPDERLFAEATASAGAVDLDLESSGDAADLDFAFEEPAGDNIDLLLDSGGLSLEESGARARQTRSDEDMLEIGAQTQAGLEAALLEDIDERGERTTPGAEIGDLESTMESPTVETRGTLGDSFADLTLESPTVETPTVETPTVETPTVESPAAGFGDGDTVEQPRPTSRRGDMTADMTAEIALDDLGLDIGDLKDMADEVIDLSGEDAGDDVLSATGVTAVLRDETENSFARTDIRDDDATTMASGFGPDSTGIRTEVLEQPVAHFDPDLPETEDDLDLNLDDFSSALDGGAETVEQPVAARFRGVDLDLDVGIELKGDDEPTGTEEFSPLDPQTMTEVGTKLDLARAYIDMGDPEGAKSILEEVLSEGDAGQRSEAQALIDALPA